MEGFAKLFFLMCLGGCIAFLGDRIGKYIGKRKLTVLNLRPRYTSQIFTVIFGMLISLTTFGILAGISKVVRQSLFEVHALEQKRQKLEQDIVQLTKVTAMNELVFHINQPIVMGEVNGPFTAQALENDLSLLLSQANKVAIDRSNEAVRLQGLQPISNAEELVIHQKADFDHTVSFLLKHPGGYVAIVYAESNTYLREKVVVGFDVRPNKRIYQSGQEVTSVTIDGKKSSEQILVELFSLLSRLQQTALNAGMIPNPVTNDFGGNVLVATLLDKRDQIKAMNGMARVRVLANKDLHIMGPLDVRFVVEAQQGYVGHHAAFSH